MASRKFSPVNRRIFGLMGGATPGGEITDEHVKNGFQAALDMVISTPARTARIQQETQRENIKAQERMSQRDWDYKMQIHADELGMKQSQLDVLEKYYQALERGIDADNAYNQAQIAALHKNAEAMAAQGDSQSFIMLNKLYTDIAKMTSKAGIKSEEDWYRLYNSDKSFKRLWDTTVMLESAITGQPPSSVKKTYKSGGLPILGMLFGTGVETTTIEATMPAGSEKEVSQTPTDQVPSPETEAVSTNEATSYIQQLESQ